MYNTGTVVRLEKDGAIAILTLCRPERLNTFSVAMRDQLYEALLAIRDDPSVFAAVICGAGRGFCAGADLTEFGLEPPVIVKRRVRQQRDVWEVLRRMPKLMVAALHGFALGSGLEMAMLCDLRFAAPETQLALPEAQLGMMPAAGGTQSLPRLLKQGIALEIALTGRRISAEEGYRLGLIDRILPAENLVESAVAFLKDKTSQDPQVSRWIKEAVVHGSEMGLDDGLFLEKVVVARAWQRKLVTSNLLSKG